MSKLKIQVEKEIELPIHMTIDELNQLAEYVKMREEQMFTGNKNIDKNKINAIKIFLEKDNNETFKLPDKNLPEFILHEEDRKILQFPVRNNNQGEQNDSS